MEERKVHYVKAIMSALAYDGTKVKEHLNAARKEAKLSFADVQRELAAMNAPVQLTAVPCENGLPFDSIRKCRMEFQLRFDHLCHERCNSAENLAKLERAGDYKFALETPAAAIEEFFRPVPRVPIRVTEVHLSDKFYYE
jgi:hypothetical protein